LAEAVSRFGATLKSKLSGKRATGAPEDPLRAPLECLIADLAEMVLFKPGEPVQWDKLRSLPNLVYTDGNAFSLWRDGKRHGEVIRLDGDVETAGATLTSRPGLERLFSDFLRWEPIPPTSARGLAEVSAGGESRFTCLRGPYGFADEVNR
jgi:hypothetical protein